MTLEIFTIVLDGLPFIAHHLPVFERLTIPWRWTIAEGAAANVNDTDWCKPQEARLSRDGTTEYLNQIARHPRVSVIQKPLWHGKTEMVNACIANIKQRCVLMQIDSDEIWESWELDSIVETLSKSAGNCMRFRCRYFLGPNIITTGDNCYGANPGEFLRAWKFMPGMRFVKHEPPVLSGINEPGKEWCFGRDDTARMGLTFNHYAYYLESQVAYKEKFYGYKDAVAHWKRLQANTVWPVKRLRDFLPWCDDRVGADLLFR